GTYDHSKNRNLNFQDSYDGTGVRNLTLMGKYGADTTIIDLNGSDFLDITSGESDSRIEGLKIINSSSGAIRLSNSSVNISNCIFENNSNQEFENGGAILLDNTNQPVMITNTLFKGNSSQWRGGAIDFWNDGAELVLMNCVFDNNNANETGGAINKDFNTNLTIVNSLFLNNTIQQTWGAAGVNIMSDNGSVEIVNSIFIDNTRSDGTDGDVDGTAYVDHCILQSETSPVFNYGENFIFPDEQLLNDPENGDYALDEYSPAIGLGLDEFYSDIVNDDIIISEELGIDYLGNARVQPAGSHPDLGPIEHTRWEQRRKVFYVDVSGSDSNDGLSAGAPLLTLGEAFNKSVIRDTIELAAGTYAGVNNRDLNFNGVDRIIRSTDGAASTIIDCENLGHAFVLENGETDSTIISGITIQNGSSDDGGAVDIDGADPIFDGVIFKDNYASVSGGAVYASDSYAEFVNCVFVGNHAAAAGAFAFSDGAVTLDFITAVGNHGDDDVSFSGDVSISNSILWGNSPVDDAADVTYSDVMGGNAGTGNYNGRPGFTDGFNGDFTLKDWSPVIGQASAENAVLYDIEGNARSDSIPDMGAYENTLDAATTYTRHYWYVSTWGSDSVSTNMGAYENPFATIQHALNHGIYDDEIHIAPGAYSESLNNWGKDLLIVGGAVPSDVTIDGNFEINGGSPALYDLHLTNNNGTNDALQINNDAVVTMYNLLITNSNYAGVTVNNDAIATMYNLTIYGNTTGIYDNSTGTVSAVNSILWNNTAETYGTPTITYSDVEDGYTGTGNIDSDPDFVAAENGDFNLQITSPCIDAGDSTYAYDSDSTVTDMGAFPLIREFLTDTSAGNIVVTGDESAVITNDFTLNENDTLFVEPGADVYFD
ncbi:MAG: right-handed parallel beta-helix repeat-containing protein, partial [Candidatus Marinimicrobia bacterium]|nr:right-handed parallel beta-helix repeat-containing protein [Candidatus Neomarinimicrobiota bacterium]